MLRFLVPVDGSDNSGSAIEKFIKLLGWYKELPEIHLLNVQLPQRGNVPLLIDKESIEIYHREEGTKALKAARASLDHNNIAYQHHIAVGSPAETITRYAMEIDCDQIVIGPRGLGIMKGLLLGSVAAQVMHLSTIPVLLIK
jgi:nucleotide-binding universal stress UspA family protein